MVGGLELGGLLGSFQLKLLSDSIIFTLVLSAFHMCVSEDTRSLTSAFSNCLGHWYDTQFSLPNWIM